MKAIKKMAVALFLAAIAAGVPHAVAQTPNIVTGERINIGLGNSVSNTNTSYCGALGQSNTVSSLSGFALGYSNNVSGPFGIGIGNTNTVSATNGVAVGMQNNVTVAGSMAFGHRNLVTAPMNIAVGVRTKANSTSSPCIVMGSGFINETGDNAYLTNTTPNSLAVGFSSTVPTLFVGPSPNNYSLGVTDRTGRVAVGNVIPQAKLHICSDKGEDAELILEPGDSHDNHTKLVLHDGLHYIKVDPDDKMEIASSGVLGIEAADISFQGGRLDLGDDSQRKLTLTPSEAPAIYCNAYRDGGIYRRHRPGSSYALEFWTDSLVMRASRNQGERGTQITNWRNALSITTDGHVTLNGQVGVNTKNNTQQYALAVDGGILTTEVYIMTVDHWPDHVFEKDYELPSLQSLRQYISHNKHLPDVPSEKEVREEGYDMGAMQSVLLQKIEELTLYIIRQDERISELEKKLGDTYDNNRDGNTSQPH